MPRPDKTFLIEAGETRFRVDLRRTAGGYEPARLIRDEAAPEAGVDSLEGIDAFDPGGGRAPLDTAWITDLLKRRPRPAREITVLSDRVTAVVAELPGATGESWQSGAEMEAQTVSGLSSSESVTAAARLPAEAGIARCRVVQTPMRDLAALRAAVSAAGGSRLVSVGPAAGVQIDPAAPQVESWSEYALFHAGGGDRIDLRGWNGPDALAEALEDAEVASALAEGGDRARLVLANPAGTGTATAVEAATRVDFSNPAGLETWSAALARACDPLTGRVLGMPVLSVPKAPPTPAALGLTAAGIALVTLLLLGGHYWLTERNRVRLEGDLARYQEPKERLDASRTRITELQRELKDLEKEEGATPGEAEVDVFDHRRRIGALLDGVAAGSGVAEAVVLEMQPDGLDTIVTGAATSFNAPQDLAGRIDEALAAHGWRAALVRRTAKLLRADGGPWSYEIRLTPGRPVTTEEAGAAQAGAAEAGAAEAGSAVGDVPEGEPSSDTVGAALPTAATPPPVDGTSAAITF